MATEPPSLGRIIQNFDAACAYLRQEEPLARNDVPGLTGLSSKARYLFEQAQTDLRLLLRAGVSPQEQQSLELLVHKSNVGLVHCLEIEAGAYYFAGFTNYDRNATILNDKARGNLELAVERLTQVSNAYIEFRESFARVNKTDLRCMRIPIIKSSLCEVYMTLGDNAQKRAQIIITPLVKEGADITDEQLSTALSYSDESFDWYACVLGVCNETSEIGVAPEPGFKAPAEEGLFVAAANVRSVALCDKEQHTRPHEFKYLEIFESLGLLQKFELYFNAVVVSRN